MNKKLREEINSKIRIEDLISTSTVVKKSYGRMMCICPFHKDTKPSLSIDVDKNLWRCFGCDKSGDIFSYIQESENVTFKEAVVILAKKAGIEIKDDIPERPTTKALELANEFFKNKITGNVGSDAINFLMKRAITPDDIDKWELGYFPSNTSLIVHLNNHSIDNQVIIDAGLVKKLEDGTENGKIVEMFSNRLIIPIRDHIGKLVGFGARTIRDNATKYLNSPSTEVFHKDGIVFGLHQAKQSIRRNGFVVITEGYFDVISLHQIGVDMAVGIMCSNITENQAYLLRRFTDKVKLLFDADDAGIKANRKSIKILLEMGFEVEVCVMKQGYDPDDFVREFGDKKTHKVIRDSINPVEYFLNFRDSDFASNSRYGRAIEKVLLSIPDPVYRDELLGVYCNAVGVSKDSVKNKGVFDRTTVKRSSGSNSNEERKLLFMMSNNDGLRDAAGVLFRSDDIQYRPLWDYIHGIEFDRRELSSVIGTNGSNPYELMLNIKHRAVIKAIEALSDKNDERSLNNINKLVQVLSVIRETKQSGQFETGIKKIVGMRKKA